MPRGRTRLASYLDQRRRMGEPGIVPGGLGPGELLRLIGERAEAEKGAGATGAAGSAERTTTGGGPARDAVGRAERAASGAGAAMPAQAAAGGKLSASRIAAADYDGLREAALTCTRCRLAEGRTTVVFSDGNPAARLMVVGEAPGADEDATGVPFVGRAGRLLDLMLASVALSRKDSVYICNVLKCRPPGNRNPMPDEIEACAPLLKRQIELVAPEVILAVGSFAAQWLTGSAKPVGRLRGEVYGYQGVPLVVTYHPAALLRNPGWDRLAWEDLQLLCQIMDSK